ncbi:MAG: SPOR domain-containing protein [Spirochaetaceae bacterium]|nr:SPOR domain-containing protein [Spirochaetaceae bacterium]MDT8296725.1 SPOR domain-containing protein [Spirochaetaceae bacterium]
MPRGSAAIPKLLIILILTIAPSYRVGAVDWQEARALELNGDAAGAQTLYMNWLAANPGHPETADIVIHASSLSKNPLDALGLMRESVNLVPEPDAHRVYARMAALESSVGLPMDAADHFRKAAEIGGAQGERWELDSLALRFGMGDYTGARQDALNLSKESGSPLIRDEAASLAALCMARDGRAEDALQEMRAYLRGTDHLNSPLAWLALKELSEVTGNQIEFRRAIEKLNELHPRTVIRYMAESRVLEWVSPASFITPRTQSELKSVQAGAFAKRDGAVSLRERLEDDGFTAWLEEDKGLWKVIVNDPDGNVVSRLLAEGYQASVR